MTTLGAMTGGEIVAGAVGAADAVSRISEAASKVSPERQALIDAARETPEFERAVNLYARRAVVKQAVLLKVFEPLHKMVGLSRDYFQAETGGFAEDLAHEMADVPADQIVEPSPSVVGPALEAMRYSLTEESLRTMYLRLIATASTAHRVDTAHPSYVETIRQLAAPEAALLPEVLRRRMTAIARLGFRGSDRGKKWLYPYVTEWVVNHGTPLAPFGPYAWMDNWQRLGLLGMSFDERMTGEQDYAWVDARPEHAFLASLLETHVEGLEMDDPTLEVGKGICETTEYGRQFASVVLSSSPARTGPQRAPASEDTDHSGGAAEPRS